MPVCLTPDLEQLVQDKVQSGLYLTPEEVVREALRLLEERDRLLHIQREELRKQIALGLQQADRGELRDGVEAFTKLRERFPDDSEQEP